MADRLKRERDTVGIMIKMYCKGQHGTKGTLCAECEELRGYAFKRLEGCKYGSRKPVCGRCRIHCYKPEMRDKIRNVMKKSGPKMIFMYPVISFYHLIDSFRYR